MPSPADRRYTETHEWHRLSDGVLTIGLTRFAVDQLTDVTFAEMKPVGTPVGAGSPVAEVESVKTTSDVYSALPGEIIEVNRAVADDPSILNSDPYEAGWLVKVRVSDSSAFERLADAAAYDARAH